MTLIHYPLQEETPCKDEILYRVRTALYELEAKAVTEDKPYSVMTEMDRIQIEQGVVTYYRYFHEQDFEEPVEIDLEELTGYYFRDYETFSL